MPAVEQQTVTLKGSLVNHRVLTPAGWSIGDIEVPGNPCLVRLVGKLLNVRVGDTVEVRGFHSTHPKYGDQFQVQSCTPVQPDTSAGVVLWMTSRLPDIGATRARALVETFGADLWSIIEKEPQRLTEVAGITEKRALAIGAAYAEVAHEREHMSLLRGWGLTENQINRCRGAWGTLSSVVEHVRADPFELASVVDGFGFKRADHVARKMGIAMDAPGRIRAAILYMLEHAATQDGHVFMWGGKLRELSARLLGVPEQLVIAQIFAVIEMQRCVRRGARVYAAKLDRAEDGCAKNLLRLLERQSA